MAKNCPEYINELNDYLDGGVTPELCAEIEAHIGRCENCRIMVDTLKQTVTLCREGKEVGELPYKDREAFLLRYIEELPVKEVARLTKQSEASAKSRILRARLALRDKLSRTFEAEYGKELS